VLAKAFQVEKKTVDWLQAQFWADNHNWFNVAPRQ
jgi:hypothetical protein